jgi:hypothetical protein
LFRCIECDEDIEITGEDLAKRVLPGEHEGCGGKLYPVIMIQCGVHGEIEWRGDVMCVKCKQIYLCEGITVSEDGRLKRIYPNAPDKGLCECGARLFGGTDFTMRPACRECATRVLKAN